MSIAPPLTEHPPRTVTFRVLRKVFSFPVAMAALLAVLAVLTVRGRFDDPDMWWHLKNGEVIWTTHSVPTTDLYSYTANHHYVIPQEWLSEALIYAAYRVGGYPGLMAWLCFFSSALLIAGFVLCSLYSGNSKIGFIGALAIWFLATVGLAVRGQLPGYLLLVCELLLLYLGRSRNPRWYFALPVIMALWVNLHASFFFGLIVLGIFLLCSFFKFRVGAVVCNGGDGRQTKTLAVATVLSIGATFLNPDGLRQVLYPLNTMFRQPVNLSSITEWQPVRFTDPRGIALLALLLAIFAIMVVRRSEVLHLDEVLLLVVGTWLALNHQRMVFVFGILAAPVLSRLLAPLWDQYEPEKDRIAPNAILIAAAILAAIIGFPSQSTLAKQVEKGSPVEAVAYIKARHLSGNMLNDYTDGGYLIWALPQHPVFIDGRADLYEWAGVLSQFGQWSLLQSDPHNLLNKYHISFCLLDRDSPMAHVMPLLPGWKQVYSDKKSVIFVRTPAIASS